MHDDHDMSEAEVREVLGLSETDLGDPELLVCLDGRARPERGPGLFYSHSRVARAQLWLSEREHAGSSAELLLSEGGHPPEPYLAYDGPYSVRKRVDQLAREAQKLGIDLGFAAGEEAGR